MIVIGQEPGVSIGIDGVEIVDRDSNNNNCNCNCNCYTTTYNLPRQLMRYSR